MHEEREGPRKIKKKENRATKGKNNMKYDRSGPADVAMGRTKNPVADPGELTRKRAEDVVACGRVIKTIPHPRKRRISTTVADTESSDRASEDGLAPTEKEVGKLKYMSVERRAESGERRADILKIVG